MLHVKVELVPHGIEAARCVLTEVFVGNDGTGNHDVGNYDVYVSDPRGKPYPRCERDGHIGRIENFNRAEGRDKLAALALELAYREASG